VGAGSDRVVLMARAYFGICWLRVACSVNSLGLEELASSISLLLIRSMRYVPFLDCDAAAVGFVSGVDGVTGVVAAAILAAAASIMA